VVEEEAPVQQSSSSLKQTKVRWTKLGNSLGASARPNNEAVDINSNLAEYLLQFRRSKKLLFMNLYTKPIQMHYV